MPFTLLLGGARSGKSALAVQLGRRHQDRHGSRVAYLATAPAGAGDADLDERIRRHRRERPESWPTTELGREYRDLLGRVNRTWAAEAEQTLFLAAGRAVPLVDPLTLLP